MLYLQILTVIYVSFCLCYACLFLPSYDKLLGTCRASWLSCVLCFLSFVTFPYGVYSNGILLYLFLIFGLLNLYKKQNLRLRFTRGSPPPKLLSVLRIVCCSYLKLTVCILRSVFVVLCFLLTCLSSLD